MLRIPIFQRFVGDLSDTIEQIDSGKHGIDMSIRETVAMFLGRDNTVFHGVSDLHGGSTADDPRRAFQRVSRAHHVLQPVGFSAVSFQGKQAFRQDCGLLPDFHAEQFRHGKTVEVFRILLAHARPLLKA